MRALVVTVLLGFGCKRHGPAHDQPPAPPRSAQLQDAQAPPDSRPDPELEEYITDVMAFSGQTHDQVRDRMKLGALPLKQEWESWESAAPMTDARIKAFYKQTTNYIYELGEWHLNEPFKRVSDVQLVDSLKQMAPKNVLDFGGGVGMLAIPLTRAGLDVTLSDLDSTSLKFAAFRANRHGDKLKIWKSDVELMPPDAKYDVILALDVLEHLPREELKTAVDKLVKLKHSKSIVVMSAPFGRTSTHPMHLDSNDYTKQQVERLNTEFTP